LMMELRLLKLRLSGGLTVCSRDVFLSEKIQITILMAFRGTSGKGPGTHRPRPWPILILCLWIIYSITASFKHLRLF